MCVTASYIKRTLHFKVPSGTSRGVLYDKDTWYIILKKDDHTAVGECGMFRGLSVDDVPEYEKTLATVCQNINSGEKTPSLETFPSIGFGLEVASSTLLAMEKGEEYLESPFTAAQDSIPINGLIWMGSKEFMLSQIREKIEKGFSCIKLKIGAINFFEELSLIKYIRNQFSENEMIIRVDTNGAFSSEEALEYMKRLSDYHLHSIEQPIRSGEWEKMAFLCANTPLPIALDEELIGEKNPSLLLETIKPQFIVLKPTLLGGFSATAKWITEAKNRGVDYWMTSALESNVGLDAIARFTYKNGVSMPQGLGTGALFTNNIPYPFKIENGLFSICGKMPKGEDILKELTKKE